MIYKFSIAHKMKCFNMLLEVIENLLDLVRGIRTEMSVFLCGRLNCNTARIFLI